MNVMCLETSIMELKVLLPEFSKLAVLVTGMMISEICTE